MQKHPKLLFFGIMFPAIMFGVSVLPLMLNISSDAGGMIGVIIGFCVSLFIPGLWKSLAKIHAEEQNEAFAEGIGLGFWRYFTHPTQLPTMLGLLWFAGFLLFLLIFNLKISTDMLSNFLLLPTLLLFGLSGLVIFLRKEYLSRPGHIIRSNWARLVGVFIIVFGWGTTVFLIVSTIFGW